MAHSRTRANSLTRALGGALVVLALIAVFVLPFWFGWPFFGGSAFILAGLLAILVGSGLWSRRFAPYCEHGIRGGENGGECLACDTLVARKIKSRELYESELGRIRKGRLASEETLRVMTPYDFETMVCNLYRATGYDVTQTPRVGDGGRDGILEKDGHRELLEVKLQAAKVGRPALQKLHSAMITDDACRGHFVAPGGFTKHAREFAEENAITLIDMNDLFAIVQRVGWGTRDSEHFAYLCVACGHYGTMPLVSDPRWNAKSNRLESDAPCGACGANLDNHITKLQARRLPRA